MAAGKKLTVVLDTRDDKKNSVKLSKEPDGKNPDNIYIPNDGMEAIGNPQKVKVTIEPA